MLRLVPFLTALACALPAQTPPCFALNDATGTVSTATTLYGFSGENGFAWQITPPSSLVLFGGQVFTRNTALSGSRFMILEIWSDNNGAPGTRLGGGAWRIDNGRPLAWQGANFDQLVVLQANVPVWVAWTEPGFSTPCEEPGGSSVPRATRTGTGAWNAGSAGAPKLRLFCTPLDGAYSMPYGSPCAQSSGRLATVFTNEEPLLGNGGFRFESSGSPPGAPVFLVLGFDPTFVSAPLVGFPSGCMQHTDVLATVLLTAGTGNTRGPTCAGHLDLALPLPNDPGLVGQLFAAQVAPLDAGAAAPLPFATSNAQRVTLY